MKTLTQLKQGRLLSTNTNILWGKIAWSFSLTASYSHSIESKLFSPSVFLTSVFLTLQRHREKRMVGKVTPNKLKMFESFSKVSWANDGTIYAEATFGMSAINLGQRKLDFDGLIGLFNYEIPNMVVSPLSWPAQVTF